jgi:hypothetical protein
VSVSRAPHGISLINVSIIAYVARFAFNIGIMVFSPHSCSFAKEWVGWIERDDDVWDQNTYASFLSWVGGYKSWVDGLHYETAADVT